MRGFAALFTSADVASDLRKTPNTQTVLVGIGQLVAFVVHSQLTDFGLGEFRQVDAKRLYPPLRDRLLWPPMNRLDAEAFAHLGQTLSRFLERPGMRPI